MAQAGLGLFTPLALCARTGKDQSQKQIPGGNDRKKSKGNSKDNSRFSAGITRRKAKAVKT
jgi:hypothetical protein